MLAAAGATSTMAQATSTGLGLGLRLGFVDIRVSARVSVRFCRHCCCKLWTFPAAASSDSGILMLKIIVQ